MAVESMRTEGEAVYEVVEVGPTLTRMWELKSGGPWSQFDGPPRSPTTSAGGMLAADRPVGTRLRVKTTTVAKIEKPKKVAK